MGVEGVLRHVSLGHVLVALETPHEHVCSIKVCGSTRCPGSAAERPLALRPPPGLVSGTRLPRTGFGFPVVEELVPLSFATKI